MKACKSALFAMLLLMLASSGFCISGDSASKYANQSTSKKYVALKTDGAYTVPAYLDYRPFGGGDYSNVMAREEFADGLHKAIRIGLDKAQAGSTRIDIVLITSPADIQVFRALLTHRQNVLPVKAFGDTRLLFDADNGETQVFVDQGGVVSQGTQLWQLSPQDFAQLKQILSRVYAAIPSPANWGTDPAGKTKTKK